MDIHKFWRPLLVLGIVAALVGSAVTAYADTPTATPPTATPIAKPQAEQHAYSGTLKSLAASSFVLTTKHKADLTISANASTKYQVPGVSNATLASFKTGDRVATLVSTSGGANIASHLHLIPAKPIHVARVGTVAAYEAGKSITIQNPKGESWTFVIDAKTKVQHLRGASDIKVGDRATVAARRDPATDILSAKQILVWGAKPGKAPAK